MKQELKIGEKVYEIANIVEIPYVKVIKEKSENGIDRTLIARSDNRFFLDMSKSMMFNTKCDNVSIQQYNNKDEVVREILLQDVEIKSTSNNSIEIDCQRWEDRYIDNFEHASQNGITPSMNDIMIKNKTNESN